VRLGAHGVERHQHRRRVRLVGGGIARTHKRAEMRGPAQMRGFGPAASKSVWYQCDTAHEMRAARAAGVTAVLIGDAAHDGGVERAAPDLYFPSAHHLAARLRVLA
jgi:phosphoglycolate phosphatase